MTVLGMRAMFIFDSERDNRIRSLSKFFDGPSSMFRIHQADADSLLLKCIICSQMELMIWYTL
jgi:hypothetical protein